jgi:signal transduction histidine kinase/CheY-like chemotaxis protein
MSTNFSYDDFFSLLESTSQAIVAFNSNRKILFANNLALSLSGYFNEELLGKPLQALIPSQDKIQKKDGSFLKIKKHKNNIELKSVDIHFTSFLPLHSESTPFLTSLREVELLYKVATLATQDYSFEECLGQMLKSICEHIGWPIGHAYLLNEKNADEIYPSDIWYLEHEEKFQEFKEITMKTKFKIGEGLPGRIFKSGKVEWSNSVLDKSNFMRAQLCSSLGVNRAFGFPIHLEDKIVCAVEFFTPDTSLPEKSLLRLMESVSQQISLVFQKQSQKHKLASKALEMELLYKASSLATQNYSIEESLQVIIDSVCTTIGWPVGHVYLASKETPDELYPSNIWHVQDEDAFQIFKDVTMKTKFKLGVGLPGRVLKSGKAEWIANVQEDSNFPRPKLHPSIEVKGAFGFPVQLEGEIICVLEFFTRTTENPNNELLKIIDAASQQISLVFQKKKTQSELTLALDTKSRFLATMSHEIRTPIAVIIGAAELIDTKDLSKDQKILFEKLKNNSANLLKLITNILDFSKGESDLKTSLDTEINLPILIDQLKENFSKTAKEKEIEFSIHIEETVPKIIVLDHFFLERILTNLIENAFKFTKKGSIHLEISKQEGMLHFLLKDTGIGISKKDIPHTFDKFRQANSQDSREFGGSGLGLSICKQLVSLLGGKISVSSTLGEGSTFTFTTLLKEKNEPSLEVKNLETDPKKLTGNILLAEDNEDNQLIINHFLKKTSCKVDLANDGKEALEKVKEGKYDLVLMDMQMPIMDGYASTKAIRDLEKDKHTIIIALTANALEEDKNKCLESGCDAYLSKPISSENLIKELSKWLN